MPKALSRGTSNALDSDQRREKLQEELGLAETSFTTSSTHVALVPAKLRILRIKPQRLYIYMKVLCDIMFMRDPNFFFCLTCTADEVSVVVDETHLGYFEMLSVEEPHMGRPRGNDSFHSTVLPEFEHRDMSPVIDTATYKDEKSLTDESLTASVDTWVAFQVYVGMGGLDLADGLASISSTLADAKISMLNIGTFGTDLILVRKKDVVQAFQLIKNVLTIINKNSRENDLKRSVEEMSPLSKNHLSIKALLERFPNIKISQVPSHAIIASIERENLRKSMYELVKIIYYSRPQFFCFVETEDEISLCLDDKDASIIDSTKLVRDLNHWIPLKFDIPDGFDFDVCGVVSAMCSPLARVRMQFVNVSTYSTDFTLVHVDDLDKALELLHTA